MIFDKNLMDESRLTNIYVACQTKSFVFVDKLSLLDFNFVFSPFAYMNVLPEIASLGAFVNNVRLVFNVD